MKYILNMKEVSIGEESTENFDELRFVPTSIHRIGDVMPKIIDTVFYGRYDEQVSVELYRLKNLDNIIAKWCNGSMRFTIIINNINIVVSYICPLDKTNKYIYIKKYWFNLPTIYQCRWMYITCTNTT